MNGIVVVNCGSSSVKLDAFDLEAKRPLWSGAVDRVGTDKASLKSEHGDKKVERSLGAADHAAALPQPARAGAAAPSVSRTASATSASETSRSPRP
jgi:acetate kinase